MKFAGDSSLHFVSLRMTGINVFKEEVVGGLASNHLLLPGNSKPLVILSEAKNLIHLV